MILLLSHPLPTSCGYSKSSLGKCLCFATFDSRGFRPFTFLTFLHIVLLLSPSKHTPFLHTYHTLH